MKTKQKIQFNRGHASVKYLIAFLFIACGGLLLARNMQWITVPVYDLLVSWQAVVAVVGGYLLGRRECKTSSFSVRTDITGYQCLLLE